jgi:hypothetical protein
MRHDFAYIARISGFTEKGDAYHGTLPDKGMEETTNPLNELLIHIQGIYILVEDNSDIVIGLLL